MRCIDRIILLICLIAAPPLMESGHACFCFSDPICSRPPDNSGRRVVFTGTVIDIFPASLEAYGFPDNNFNLDDDRKSVLAHKSSILRLWAPFLSAKEAQSIRHTFTQGQLRSVTDLNMIPRLVRFRVTEWLEGGEGDEFQVFSESDSCGYRFDPGKPYLVVAARNEETHRLWVHACSRTAPVDSVQAQEDLKALREWKTGRTPASRIFGDVFDSRQPPGQAYPYVLLRLKGELSEREIRSDGQGRFSFDGLQPVKYQLEAEFPNVAGKPTVLDLTRHACFEASVIVEKGDADESKYVILESPLGARQ